MTFNFLTRRGAWWLITAVLVLGAFLFRLPALSERPMHTDEAVHAVKLGILLEAGEYEYNPHEYHGPLIYYAAMPFVRASGARTLAGIPDEKPLRMPIVIFGALLVGVVALCGRGLGIPEALFAALLLGVSPAFSFYSRYFIQEIPFVFFCFASLACAWQMLQTQRWYWAVAAGLAAGCAVGLKETWILIFGAAGLTALLLHLTTSHGMKPRPVQWRTVAGVTALAIGVGTVTGLAILSNFFRNPAAVGHTFEAIGGYINRGISGDSSTFGSNIHDYPGSYYFRLLVAPTVEGPWIWTEVITLALGTIGLVSAVRRWTSEPRPWHFIAIFTILLTGFYSAIPYKTPWNVLPMFLGWTLLAGRGAVSTVDTLARAFSRRSGSHVVIRVLLWMVMLAWPAWLGVQSWRATILRPADTRNPYAYSATSPNLLRLVERAESIAAVAPDGRQMIIQVISAENDYWPLPWYLRRFPNIGYYTDVSEASEAAAMIVITHPTENDAPPAELPESAGPRMQEFYGLRNDVMLNVFIRQGLWDEFIETQL